MRIWKKRFGIYTKKSNGRRLRIDNMQVEEWLGADNTLGIDIWNKKYRQNGESFDEWLERVSGGSASIKRLIIEKKFLFGGRILSNRGMPDKGQKVTYSNCFRAGTMVTTSEGIKPIDSVNIGDKVLTHTGKYQTVKNILKRQYDGAMYTIRSEGVDVVCTSEHPFLTKRGWIKACDLIWDIPSEVDALLKYDKGGNKYESGFESITVEYSVETVYNLSVDIDESYVANGYIVHNCYVVPAPEDSIESIFESASKMARTFSYGGGVGIDLSKLAPRGARVNNTAKFTTGAVSFTDLYSFTTGLIGQNQRRGATMLSISCEHPDAEEFMRAKMDVNRNTSANMSIRMTDDFMRAVEGRKMFDQIFKREVTGEIIKKEIDASKFFDELCYANWDYGEPGCLYWDRIENWNLLSEFPDFHYAGVNPCAEEPLPAGGSCLLGSLNLSEFAIGKSFDFHGFQIAVQLAVVALNEVLDEGLPLHPLQEQRDSVKDWRQIGLGIMGLADMLIKLGIRYGSEEAIALCDRIGSCMINSALAQSARLAWEHGSFPKCNNTLLLQSKFLQENATKEVIETIRKHGLRNSQLLTIAPTGTLSTMLGISGGIEPIFATHYDRTTKMEGTDKVYRVYTPCVKEYMEKNKVDSVDELPEEFVTAQNLDWKSRVDMQAIWQKHIDASISSTVNLPEDFPQEDVKGIYMSAWKSGCKGITVFRDGCKRLGILTTKTGEKTEDKTKSIPVDSESVQTLEDVPDEELVGKKRKIMTGCGNLHITAFFDKKSGMLKEIFLSKGSTGGCLNFMNGLSRMISLSARKGIPFNEIIDQLKSSGACSAYAVRSATHHDTSKGACCPMAVGNALIEMQSEMCSELGLETNNIPKKVSEVKVEEPKPKSVKNPCPNCGTELQFSGGCNQCPSCGYSKCS